MASSLAMETIPDRSRGLMSGLFRDTPSAICWRPSPMGCCLNNSAGAGCLSRRAGAAAAVYLFLR